MAASKHTATPPESDEAKQDDETPPGPYGTVYDPARGWWYRPEPQQPQHSHGGAQ